MENVKFKKYNTNFSQLLGLFFEMSEEKQKLLIEHAEKIRENRQNPRIPCLIYANYEILNTTYNGFILDITVNGAFIETDSRFDIDAPVNITFFSPFIDGEIELKGKIIRETSTGIGIDFLDDAYSKKKLEDFLFELKKYDSKFIR
ncbi:MAG: PilZ domain-containing protein [Desulfobacterales bacterium]|jgi:hypothetical protein